MIPGTVPLGIAQIPPHASAVPPKKSRRYQVGIDLSGQDLRAWNFHGANLKAADLRQSDLRGVDLRGVDLYAARLEGADLRAAQLEMTRLLEIRIPKDLDLTIVNQIRAFDFLHTATRFVGPNINSESLACPYRHSRLSPVLFEWGSRTWNAGAGWNPPRVSWTLEEIIAAVLSELGCRHEYSLPCRR